MTAFARGQIKADWGIASCEIRSVNSRYLDLKLVLPEMLTNLEAEFCSYIKQHLQRGKVECYVRCQHENTFIINDISLNYDVMHKVVKACQEIQQYCPRAQELDLLQILRWPGVMANVDAKVSESMTLAMRSLLQTTVQDLILARQREGKQLRQIMLQRLALITEQLRIVQARMPIIVVKQREHLLSELQNITLPLETQQLSQCLLEFVKKIDITEEVERLGVHLTEITRLLSQGGVTGRRLDFLIQELQREANTVGAKSVDIDVTYAVVEIKVLIEQLREQVQNIE
jgi:uncharacterized protein (TIGR00255 family)